MAPRKRRGTANVSGTTPPKMKKTASRTAIDSAVESLKVEAKASKTKRQYAIDKQCDLAGNSQASVFEDYSCMLNQTNIGQNNNKFYIIQIIQHGKWYTVFTRWGRVGEIGQKANLGKFSAADSAIKAFEKKYTDKTRGKWSARNNFIPYPRKYTLLDMADADEQEDEEETAFVALPNRATGAKTKLQSKLDKQTQDLLSLIFDTNMFQDQMKNFKIDVKRMPLGKLSKSQIAKGFDCLEGIEKAIKSGKTSELAKLSSEFYTLIPHDFGRVVPPVIRTESLVREKMDMLLVLGDIELAQSMQKSDSAKRKDDDDENAKHPLDEKYELLECELSLVSPKSQEFNVLKKYTELTKSHGRLVNIWRVDRKKEAQRFASHRDVTNRKLLWHGTNIAVVAAILKSGLRIMPHSGGRLGKGIYFASEQAKSSCYMSLAASGRGVMFLNEVVLGEEYSNTTGDHTLTKPPNGYNSIVGRGRQEPDPKELTTLKLDEQAVVVPQGKPKPIPEWSNSGFWQSEYLIYKESQCRMRYLLEFAFH